VSRMVQQAGLKVVLSGLGGDEQFGGYPSFTKIPFLANLHKRSGGMAKTAASIVRYLTPINLLSSHGRIQRLTEFLASQGGYSAAYWAMRGFLSPHEAIDTISDLTGRPPTVDSSLLIHESTLLPQSDLDKVALLESTLYMRNQLLRDSDAMSMANGLELRVPFVDRKLTDFLNRVSPEIRYSRSKRFLLAAVPEIPEWVANRPKKGFRFPLEQWVNEDWKKEFEKVEGRTRVQLGSWYRKWIVFLLQRFMDRHGITD